MSGSIQDYSVELDRRDVTRCARGLRDEQPLIRLHVERRIPRIEIADHTVDAELS
jgi:hypothetical protein